MNTGSSIRAWSYAKAGSARDVMHLKRMAAPEPAAGEVLVETKVSAVNPTDIKRRTTGRELGSFGQIIPNNDGAGIIVAVGEGVPSGRVGEHVWLFGAQAGRPHGTASSMLAVPSPLAVELPKSASFADGACIGVPAVTAWHGVLGDGPVTGRTVLVTGAGGRVGRYGVQIAKAAGARVIALSRPEKSDELEKLGASAVVDYTTPDPGSRLQAAAPDGIDRVCDATLALTLEHVLPALNMRAVIAAYASDMNPAPALPFAQMLYANIVLTPFSIFALSDVQRDAALTGVSELLGSGKLRHHVGARFEFDQMIDAHEAVETGQVDGACLVAVR
ncbi:zinc-binding dehydrogenase [Anderseniella sp. Alg231-50]|uniref:zinc-binding dehydrogenase n=1 Tax=Anderseniella sp. Alg231-50 TaxID=1922226 RepID=UPI000D553689